MSIYRRSFIALLIFVLGMGLVWVISPPSMGGSKAQLSAKDVQFRAVQSNAFSIRFAAFPTEGTLNQQFSARQTSERRFFTTFQDAPPFNVSRSLYIPSAGGKIRVVLNGVLINESSKAEVLAPSWGRDYIQSDFPRELLLPGTNRVDIYVDGHNPRRSGVRQIYLGETERIEKIASSYFFWAAWLPRLALCGAILVVLASIGGVAFTQRKALNLLCGLIAAVLGIQASLHLVSDAAPVLGAFGALEIIFPFAVILGLCALGWRIRSDLTWGSGLKFGLWFFALIGPVAMLLYWFTPLYISWQGGITTLILTSALPLTGYISISHLISYMRSRKSQIDTLQAKVSSQSTEIDQQTRLLIKEQRQRAMLEERARFTRDIHDGIGGQLLSLLLRVRSGELKKSEIAEEIQSGLHDLRLVVDSLDNIGEDLRAALSTFKLRIEPQMLAANIEFDWKQTQPLNAQITRAGGTLNLYRFMQEAITNVIRHADATRIEVSVDNDTYKNFLIVQISDDGVGFDIENNSLAGKGLKNLNSRAESLGAQLEIKSEREQGTVLRLVIPLQIPEDYEESKI